MSVIAWKKGVLAADRRSTSAGMSHTVEKIFAVDGMAVGVSGELGPGMEMVEWFKDGAKPADFPKCGREGKVTMVVLSKMGARVYDESPHPFERLDAFGAIGSGRDFAVAAMHLGKSAIAAVEIASLFQVDCGNGVTSIRPSA